MYAYETETDRERDREKEKDNRKRRKKWNEEPKNERVKWLEIIFQAKLIIELIENKWFKFEITLLFISIWQITSQLISIRRVKKKIFFWKVCQS